MLSMTHEPVFLKSTMTSEITGFRLGINGMSNDTIMLPCKLNKENVFVLFYFSVGPDFCDRIFNGT